MRSLLKSTLNTRAILPNTFRFLRSDVPKQMIPEDIAWLLDHNVTTIVDLRTETEQRKTPCPLAYNDRFTYYSMPVTGGNRVPASVDDVSKSYIAMVDEQMHRIIERICSATSNVMYFCNAGKDRTGVVSAMLLYRLGMDSAYIIHDYLESGTNLKSMLDAYAKQFPDVDIHIITPSRRYMQEFLDWLASQD